MTHVRLCTRSNRISVRIMMPRPGDPRRELAVSLGESEHGILSLAIVGRLSDQEKFQPYPGEDIPMSFLNRMERAVLGNGLEELANCARGLVLNDEAMKLVISVVRDVLECTACRSLLDDAGAAG